MNTLPGPSSHKTTECPGPLPSNIKQGWRLLSTIKLFALGFLISFSVADNGILRTPSQMVICIFVKNHGTTCNWTYPNNDIEIGITLTSEEPIFGRPWNGKDLPSNMGLWHWFLPQLGSLEAAHTDRMQGSLQTFLSVVQTLSTQHC